MLNTTELEIILLINVKMPTTVGILTFISRIKATSKSLKQEILLILQLLSFYEQWKFHAQLS